MPVVFAKKSQSINLDGEQYSTRIESFTHKRVYDVIVSKKYLQKGDKVLMLRVCRGQQFIILSRVFEKEA